MPPLPIQDIPTAAEEIPDSAGAVEDYILHTVVVEDNGAAAVEDTQGVRDVEDALNYVDAEVVVADAVGARSLTSPLFSLEYLTKSKVIIRYDDINTCRYEQYEELIFLNF